MNKHVSVLPAETIDALCRAQFPQEDRLFLDATFGGGGHTRALLETIEASRLVSLDCDPAAMERTELLSEEFGSRFTFHSINFRELSELEEDGFAGALFDLGLSSYQYDTPERGFSFRFSASSDMRLNTREGQTAAEFLETASRDDLVKAVREYGEESRWRKVVDAIISARGTGLLSDTKELADLIAKVAPAPRHGRGSKINPATKTFQGIRIAINDELGAIEEGLPAAFEKLAIGGILAVISFHSLEDRIVKRFFRRMAGRPEHGRDNRLLHERVCRAELVTRKPITPSEQEIEQNPRSRSAKLRVLRKTA